MKPGQRVRHWFAGTGRVLRYVAPNLVRVAWDSGSCGIAYTRDCKSY